MSDLAHELLMEDIEEEREKFSFYVVHKKNDQTVHEDWFEDYEETEAMEIIERGRIEGYEMEWQKLAEGESPA